jgi:hypothetical protein
MWSLLSCFRSGRHWPRMGNGCTQMGKGEVLRGLRGEEERVGKRENGK